MWMMPRARSRRKHEARLAFPVAKFSVEPNERITFKVRYEDEDLLVINKPARLVTAPGLGHETDSLLSGLFAHFGNALQNLGRERDFGLLHRLDRDTSGLVLVALRPRAYDRLREVFEKREVSKFYWAVTAHAPKAPDGVIRKPLAEYEGKVRGDTRTKKLARISSGGKPALTAYRVLDTSPVAALLECRALTGRLHQLRVHLESINCSILGDEFYGPVARRAVAPRLALHAHRLVFPHPASGERLDITTAWPSDLKPLLKKLHLKRPDLNPHPATAAGATDEAAAE